MSKEKITVEKQKAPETTFEFKEGKIGTMLHDVRLKKKLSIEDVSKNLCIKTSYLTAIEESDYSNIPADPYGTGFIRSYASFLGLNSTRIVQIFKEEINPSGQEETPVSTPVTKEPVEDEVKNNFEIYIPDKKTILISLGILILTYLLWSVLSSSSTEETVIDEATLVSQDNDFPVQIENYTSEEENSDESNNAQNISKEEVLKNTSANEQKDEDTSEEKVAEKPVEPKQEKATEKKEEKKVDTKTEKAPAITSAPKKIGRVVLKVKKETWIEVKDEDKLWISKVLHAGDEYVLPEDGVGKTVSFGNTDGVDVVIDGKVVTIISNNKKTNIQMDAFLSNH